MSLYHQLRKFKCDTTLFRSSGTGHPHEIAPHPDPLPASGAREQAGKTPRPAPAGRGRGPRQREGEGQPSADYAAGRGGDSLGVTVISSFCDRRSTVTGTGLPTRSSVISRCNSSTSPTGTPSTATITS